MAKMTPENLTEGFIKICGDNLSSVVLYGSAVAGDSVKTSDYNVLVVLNRLEAQDLAALTDLCTRWGKDGNPVPLLFSKESLLRSADVFPVEFADIMQTHKLLFGDYPFAGMKIETEMLRLELERELKSKLILLRGRFLSSKGSDKEIANLMVSSLSAFLTLFKAVLRLYGQTPPSKKMEVLPLLSKHISFDEEIFQIVWELKDGKHRKGLTSMQIFSRYLPAIQNIADSVDLWLQNTVK